MENEKLNFDIKAAFTFNAITYFGFDANSHEKPVNVQQVVLLNREEVITQKKIKEMQRRLDNFAFGISKGKVKTL